MSAFARSASGPGGLSINTGTANSLFGSAPAASSQPQAAGVLFSGSAQPSTQLQPAQPIQPGGLFGSAATSQPQTTGSLFGQPQKAGGLLGSTSTMSQPQQPSGGLFGASTAAPQTQTTGTGGLFGTATAQQPLQQPTGGLFGNTTQPQQQTGGLFGSTTQAQQQQPQQQTGGLFGASPAQPAATGGLFGTGTQQAAPAGGLFGGASTTQQQPQTTGGLFGKPLGNSTLGQGTTTAQVQPSLFGGLNQSTNQQPGLGRSILGSGLGLGQSQQQRTVPGVRIDLSNIKSTTRFNDLQEDLQKQIAQIDEAIQKCIKDKEAVDAFIPAHGDQIAQIPHDVSFVGRKSEGANNALQSDVAAVKELKELVKVDADNARRAFKAIDNLNLPAQYHQAGLWATKSHQAAAAASQQMADTDAEDNADLISFFSRTADEIDKTMKLYERNLGEIEIHLHGVQAGIQDQRNTMAAHSRLGGSGADAQLAELAAALREFEEGIFQVAAKVGSGREGMTELQLKEFMGNGIS